MTLSDYLDDLNAHPPKYPLDLGDVAEIAAAVGVSLFVLVLAARILMPVAPEPVRVIVDLTPRATMGVASVIADINAEAMVH